MKILRIPKQYNDQVKFCSTEDCEYILKTIFELANNPEKKVENSMRGGLVSSIWREAVQMENKARAKKGKKNYKPLSEDVATLSQDMSDKGCDTVESEEVKKVRPIQINSNQFKSIKVNKEEGISFEIPTLTPGQITKEFFENSDQQKAVSEYISKNQNIEISKCLEEVSKFVNYWMEKTKSGKKRRWEGQKTFEVKLRILNWFRKSNEFSKPIQKTSQNLNFNFTPKK